MRKLLFLLLFFPAIVYSQTQVVNVGAAANDGTGDPLRVAFQKINTNRAAIVDSFSVHNSKIYQTRNVVLPNAIQYEKDNGVEFADAIAASLEAFAGTGGITRIWQLRGIVGVTSGFPDNNDTQLTHTAFTEHTRLNVFKNGSLLWRMNAIGDNPDGYTFNQATGTITFKTALSTNDLIIVQAYDAIVYSDLSPQGDGGGGGGGESSLLNGLLASWSLDETSGTTVIDNLGDNNGASSGATVNQAGKFGRAYRFTTQTGYIQVPNSSSYNPGSSFTVSMWFKLDKLPNPTDGKNYFPIRKYFGAPTNPWSFEIMLNKDDNYIAFYVINSSGTYYAAETSANFLSTDTWYNVICTYTTGQPLKIYVDNSDETHYNAGGNWSGSVRWDGSGLYIGNALYDGTSAVQGYIDEVNIWNRVLTSDERAALQTHAYPFSD